LVRGHQRGARGHLVARKVHGDRPPDCSENNISVINVFTLTNINTKMKVNRAKFLFQKLCIKLLFALIGTQEVARSYKKVGDPCGLVVLLQAIFTLQAEKIPLFRIFLARIILW